MLKQNICTGGTKNDRTKKPQGLRICVRRHARIDDRQVLHHYSIPTMMVLEDGQIQHKMTGARGKAQILAAL